MTINLGMRAHDVNPHQFSHLFDILAQYHLNNVQFAPSKFLPQEPFSKKAVFTPGLVDTLNRQFEQHQVAVSVLGCYVNIVDLDPAKQQASLAKFRESLSIAARLRAGVVATETGSVSPEGFTPANYTEAAYQRMVQAVRQMARDAERFGVIVAVEPGVNHPLYNNQTVRRLLDDVHSPNLKVIFDLANILSHDTVDQQAAVLAEAQRLYGAEIYGFHIKDFAFNGATDGDKKYCPVGTGVVDIPAYVQFIEKLKPYCYATFEGVSEVDLPAALALVKANLTADDDVFK